MTRFASSAWGPIRRYGDIALGAAAAALLLAEYAGAPGLTAADQRLAGVLSVAAGVGVALRRRAPLLLLGALVVEATLDRALPHAENGLGWAAVAMIAIYTAAVLTEGRPRVAAGAMAAVLPVIWLFNDRATTAIDGGSVVGYGLFAAVPWVFGTVVHRRRQRERLLENRAAILEEGAAERARTAVDAERARIARELHDVVGHALGVIVVQADGAGRVIAAEPAQAERALTTIAVTGREALAEMRRLVGLLRVAEERTDLSPQPGLARLGALVVQMREAGLPVEVVIEGDPEPLAPGIDVSAYRIVQEALTNVLRHAGPARARLTLGYRDGAVEVTVVDDGDGPVAVPDGSGHGLVGIRERAALVGGEASAGPGPAGGYAVRARLPYTPPA